MKYPKTDGLAKLWESVIEDLSEDCVHFKTKIKSIDAENKVITTTKDIEVKLVLLYIFKYLSKVCTAWNFCSSAEVEKIR